MYKANKTFLFQCLLLSIQAKKNSTKMDIATYAEIHTLSCVTFTSYYFRNSTQSLRDKEHPFGALTLLRRRAGAKRQSSLWFIYYGAFMLQHQF